jgi:hypothetical protein
VPVRDFPDAQSRLGGDEEERMTTIENWPELLEAVQPFLSSSSPLAEMKRAGFVFGGEVAQAADRAVPIADQPRAGFEPDGRPPLSMRLYVGRRPPAVASRTSGYRVVASADLGLLNDVLAELWRVRTIPNSFDQDFTKAKLITVTELNALCDEVPNDATEAALYVTSPPIASRSTAEPTSIHFSISLQLLLNSNRAASLGGVLSVDLPLDFHVVTDESSQPPEAVVALSLQAVQGLTASFGTDSVSAIQPKPEGGSALSEKCAAALRQLLLILMPHLVIPARVGFGSTFPNTGVTVAKAGVVTVRAAGRDFGIGGINIDSSLLVDPATLTAEELPAPPADVHAVIDEAFATEVLSAAIASGDLAASINARAARHSPVDLPNIVVTGGSVTFNSQGGEPDSSGIQISVDCVAQAACDFGIDLDFSLRIAADPSIVDGRLVIEGILLDIDVSTWDEVKCALVAVPGWGTVFTLLGEAILEVLPSFLAWQELDYSLGSTTNPLPNSEKVVQLEVTQATLSPGTLRLEGQARLIPDLTRTFAYLRFLDGLMPAFAGPLAGVTVELLEVHDFAQAPMTGETDTFSGKFEIDTVTSYRPLPDISLGTARTDNSGYVEFAVVCPQRAGILTTRTTTTNIDTKAESSTTRDEVISEGWTDLAITVTDDAGTVFTTRQIVGTNITNRRFGSRDHPVVVKLRRPIISKPA